MLARDIPVDEGHTHKARGSRAWFDNQIVRVTNDALRSAIIKQWHAITVPRLGGEELERAFAGADFIEGAVKVARTIQLVYDAALQKKLTRAFCKSDNGIKTLGKMFEHPVMKTFLENQILTEDQIIDKAQAAATIRKAEIRNEMLKPEVKDLIEEIRIEHPELYEQALDEVREAIADKLGGFEQKERNRLRVAMLQGVEYLNIFCREIGEKKQAYASSEGIRIVRALRKKNIHYAERKAMTIEKDGELIQISLLDLMQKKREMNLAELFCKIDGFQKHCDATGHNHFAFIVATADGRYHPSTTHKDGWNYATPAEANQYIMRGWKSVRAGCKNISIAGLTTAEFHASEVPHKNFVIACKSQEDLEKVVAKFRAVKACPNWQNDVGLSVRYGKDMTGTTKRTVLFNYCIKYSLKTIDELDFDKMSREAQGSAVARRAWKIRAISWFGLPTKGSWEELRALKTAPSDSLKAIHTHARNSDYQSFLVESGGVGIKRKNRPLKIKKESGDDVKSVTFYWKDEAGILITKKKWTMRNLRKGEKVTLSENCPRNPTPQLQNPLRVLEDIIERGAPPPDHTGEVFFAGEWFPF